MFQVKRNLSPNLIAAKKVKLKIGLHALSITDRTIWQKKIDRIPNSLITDAYTDSDNPSVCYFVNETGKGRYQITAILCKSVEDAYQLVTNCWNRIHSTPANHSTGDKPSIHETNPKHRNAQSENSLPIANKRFDKLNRAKHSTANSHADHSNGETQGILL